MSGLPTYEECIRSRRFRELCRPVDFSECRRIEARIRLDELRKTAEKAREAEATLLRLIELSPTDREAVFKLLKP